MSTVYLAGPMRGIPHYNFPEFEEAEGYLRGQCGWTVLSPATHDLDVGFDTEATLEEQDFDLGEAFVWDVASIVAADFMYVLPGWEHSTGACIEVDIAHMLGKPVYTMDHDPLFPPEQEPITEEAHRLVYGDRGDDYGPPLEDFARTAKMWEAILGTPFRVTPKQVALCMVAVKVSREVHRPKRENRVDLVGYALCADRVETGR